ncbi:hypothetical protein ABIA00_001090 [Bradyrhizobium ottawaense]
MHRRHLHALSATRRHAFALSRRVSPEACCRSRSLKTKGRREGRAPAAPASPCATKMHTGWTTGDAGRPAFPARLVLTVSFVLSSGSDALLPPSPCGMIDARARSGRRITASLDAQTPGVRTTRLLRPRTIPPKSRKACVCSPSGIDETAVTAPCRIAWPEDSRLPALSSCRAAPALPRPPPPGPHLVTIAKRPFGRGRDGRGYATNPKFGKAEYFCAKGLTGCFARRVSGSDPHR